MAGRNLSGDIYEALASRINTWTYPPGYRLTEDEISAEFGVSRSPVREALNMLAESCLIEKRERKGYSVRRIDLREVNEYYETRLALETAVVGLLCRNGMDESVLAELEQRWRALLDALPDMAEQAALEDEHFHEALAKAAGNRVMQRFMTDIDRRIHFVRLADITDPGRLRTTCLHHLEILEAIRKRDRIRASRMMRRNVEWGRKKVASALKDALARAYGVT